MPINLTLLKAALQKSYPADVARKFGVSRERIRQLIKKYNLDSVTLMESRYKNVVKQLSKLSDKEVVEHFNIKLHNVRHLRDYFEVKRPARRYKCYCNTKPYAKGLCKNCYMRHLRSLE